MKKALRALVVFMLLPAFAYAQQQVVQVQRGKLLPIVDDPDFHFQQAWTIYAAQSSGKELARWLAAYRCYVGYQGKRFPKRYAIIFGKVDGKYEKRSESFTDKKGKQKQRDRWYLLSYNSKTYQLCPEKPFIHRSPFGRMEQYYWGGIQVRKLFPGEVKRRTKTLGYWVARYCGFVTAFRPQPYAFYVAAVTDMLIEDKSVRKTATYFGVECFDTKEERDTYAYEIAVKLGVIKPKSRTQPKGKGRGG